MQMFPYVTKKADYSLYSVDKDIFWMSETVKSLQLQVN